MPLRAAWFLDVWVRSIRDLCWPSQVCGGHFQRGVLPLIKVAFPLDMQRLPRLGRAVVEARSSRFALDAARVRRQGRIDQAR